MEIRRDTAGYNSLTDPKPASPSRGVHETAHTRVPAERELNDRRRRPDRRCHDRPIAGSDRRKKPDRRQPKLLNSRRLKPEKLEDRRGRLVDVSV
jgi:hypothetical protein